MHLRAYEELSGRVLMGRARANEKIAPYLPDVPQGHRIDKTYLITLLNLFDNDWLVSTYKGSQIIRAEKKRLGGKKIVLKDDIKKLYETTSISSGMMRVSYFN